MCGLFGATSSFLTDEEVRQVKQLGILSYFRGEDATGVIHISKPEKIVSNKFRVRYRKTLDNPINFWQLPEVNGLVHAKGRHTMALVGHTRAATSGDSTKVQNAHPYKSSHIIGMHNGTIPSLSPRSGGGTDSKALIEMIAEYGLETALGQVGHGSFALVWVDKNEMSLNFMRNEFRPLWFCTDKYRQTLYWASDPSWFEVVLGERGKEAYQLKPDIKVSIDLVNQESKAEQVIYQKPTGPYAYGGYYLGYEEFWKQ